MSWMLLCGLARLAWRRTFTLGALAAVSAGLAVCVARAQLAALDLPAAAGANAALVLWLGSAAALVPLACALLGARGGMRLPDEAAWCARWPRHPAVACLALGTCSAFAGVLLACAAAAVATLWVARTARIDTQLVRALPGPELLLTPGAPAQCWRLEDPRGELREGRLLQLAVASFGGASARVEWRVTRAAEAAADAAKRLANEALGSALVAGAARLVVAVPAGTGALDFELRHAGGSAWLSVGANSGALCEPREAPQGGLRERPRHALTGGFRCGLQAWTARLAAAGFAAAGLAFGFARWMRPGFAVSLALLPFALLLLGVELPRGWPLADWSACLAWAADGVAVQPPAPFALACAAGLGALGIALAVPRGARA